MAVSPSGTKKWLPLESNPDVLNEFAAKLGFDTSQYAFCDVYGLDEELLALVPQPVLAVLLLFPITSKSEAAKQAEEARIQAEGQAVSSNVYFMKQTISNACGTIGVLHAIGNNQDKCTLAPGAFLERFFSDTASMTPEARGRYLEDPPVDAPDIDKAHKAAAQEGDTTPPALDEVVDLHFVALVHQSGCLFELDGRKAFPINHGPSTPDTLFKDAIAVVRKFMSTTDSVNFNLIALTTPQTE
ncbi:hypothetical protein WJX72_010011 [[Myrmecia] bisecta]|uniref:Ubiquitin carboxyl-terminal hydrolase n=1 Tax=[Myrmecia] bisecta TaxID=41462 RepID=A0AAW1P7F3_9CHLO